MKTKKIDLSPYLLILPAMLFVVILVAYPVCNSVLMSFQKYNLAQPLLRHFVGFANYVKVIHDKLFWQSLVNTVWWVVFGVGLQFVFGFIFALILNRQFKGRGLIRAVGLVPWVTPGVLIGLMWTWMFDGNNGVINDILKRLGIIHHNIAFLSQSNTVLGSVITTIVWQGIPFFAIMLLAGLQSVPRELYEAADVDGCSKFLQLFKITIPSIKNTIFVTTMLRIIWVANSIDVIISMTNGGPGYSSTTLSVYAFKNAYGALDFGYASTLSIFLTLILMVVAFFYLRNFFKNDEAR